MASHPDGGFVAVWETEETASIVVRRFDALAEPLGDEVSVATHGASPTTAVLPDGSYVVVWWATDETTVDVVAQLYAPDGTPRGEAFTVNTPTDGYQTLGDVAVAADGFVVVWQSDPGTGDEDVFARRFDAAGNPLGDQFQVNTTTEDRHIEPRVAANAAGGFVVTWMEYAADAAYSDVLAQRYSPDGSPSGSELVLTEDTTSIRFLGDVAMAPDGTFVVITNGSDALGDFRAFARLFDTNGAPLTTAMLVPSNADATQESVEAGSDGAFLMAGTVGPICANDDWGCYFSYVKDITAREISPSGALGDELDVNTWRAGGQVAAAVAGLVSGGFVVLWQSAPAFLGVPEDGDGAGIFGQLFADPVCGDTLPDGNVTATDALVVLTAAVGSRQCPVCMCDTDGGGLVTASDALLLLRASIGEDVSLACTAC